MAVKLNQNRYRFPAGEPDQINYDVEEILTEYGAGLEQKLTDHMPPEEIPDTESGERQTDMSAESVLQDGVEMPDSSGTESMPDTPPAESGCSPAESGPDILPELMAETLSVPDTESNPVPETDAGPESKKSPDQTVPAESPDQTAPAESPDRTASAESVSLTDVVGQTVDAVKAEHYNQVWRRRALFSRRLLRDSSDLYGEFGPESVEKPEIIGPEPPASETAERFRKQYERRREGLPAALAAAMLPLLVLLAEWAGIQIPLLTGNPVLRNILLLGCLAGVGWLCRQVFTDSRSTGAFLCGLSAIVCGADCITALALPGRSTAEPYGAAACLAMVIAKFGMMMESRGMYDTFRTAALDDAPPWMVTDTDKGACKQRGALPGFHTAAVRRSFASSWQSLLLPLVLAASMVFAFLSSAGQDRGADFFLNWSAVLLAGTGITLPLCWGLPWGLLARRLQKAGCAVAGWYGAERISRRKKMIVTDGDLFPAGSVRLNGMKLYTDHVEKAVSCAATMARTSGSGLEKVFDDLLRSEAGNYLAAENFRFYQEGGWSAVIGGETVLFGTAEFLRRMGQRLPDNVRLSTGLFLSAGTDLLAAFALRYQATENVDYALRRLQRSRVTMILAARDPYVTPNLLARQFKRKLRMEYPGLAARVALSEAERDRDLPRGLLLREGLLPYAETVTGSRKLCRGVRRATVLGLFGSAAGSLLAFYLVFQSRYNLLTPLTLLLFLFLWLLPALLAMELF